VTVYRRVAVRPPESLTVMSNEKDPTAVGVPEICPAEDSVSPGGSAPLTDHR